MIKIKLTKNDINDFKERIDFVTSTFEDVTTVELVDNILKQGVLLAKQFDTTAPETMNTRTFDKEITETSDGYTKGKVFMEGIDSIYSEFGTGEVGKENHILEPTTYGLNNYNTGKFVKSHVNHLGRHYWFYKPMAGRNYYHDNGYTEGMPAGLQMYRTLSKLKENVIRDASKKAVEDSINRLYKR